MTCDERLEALLNRAGQTFDEPRIYTQDEMKSAMAMSVLELAVRYLQDVRLIDCMEKALENVCGERDYLLQRFKREMQCKICVHELLSTYEEPCNSCLDKNETPYFEYTGVPEGWRVDDE